MIKLKGSSFVVLYIMGNQGMKKINKKLGVPIVGKLEATSLIETSSNRLVLGCYVLYPDNSISHPFGRLFSSVVVTSNVVLLFCLLTGEKRHTGYRPSHGQTILNSVFTRDSLSSPQIIISESNGGFAVIEPYTLNLEKRFGLTHVLPGLNDKKDRVLKMISVAPEIIYVGYQSGVVKVWHTEVANPQFVFGVENEDPPVSTICYSSKHRKVIVGFEGYVENPETSKPIKLETNPLKLYIPDASSSKSCSSTLAFVGTCLSIGLIERPNLLVAISSESSGIYIWSLLTCELLLQLTLPKLEKYPQVIMQALVVERPDSNFLVLGSSDGSAVVAEVKMTSSNISFIPLKKIIFRLEGKFGVSFIGYEEKIDTLIMGNTSSTCSFISNFFADEFQEQLSVELEQKIDEEI
jgi:hypothetical protein